MSARPEILFLAHRIPYPPDKGDKIRSWRLLSHLTKTFRVHLAAFVDDAADLQHEELLAGMCESVRLEQLAPLPARLRSARALLSGEPLSFAYYRSTSMARHVRRLRARRLAAEFVFSSAMAQYVKTPMGRPRLVDFCDSDAEKWRQYAESAGVFLRAVYAKEAGRLADAETDILNWADAAFAISAEEAAIFGKRAGARRRPVVLRNGVDCEYFSPDAVSLEQRPAAEVVFVGAMDYAPNVEAAAWFVREVWPTVRARTPSARFSVIGPRPAPSVRALSALAGVTVLGRVDDVRPWLAGARAVVAPLRIARGVQNKVLEAMAMARPVVATPEANTGIGATPDAEILIAGDADAFAGAVSGLIADSAGGDRIGAAARARMRTEFDWGRHLATLDAAFDARPEADIAPQHDGTASLAPAEQKVKLL